VRRPLICFAFLLAVVALTSRAVATSRPPAVKWRSLADGEAEAKKTGRPVLYFFTADWCGPCHILVRQVFSDAKTVASIESLYVPVVLEDRRQEDGANAAGMERLAQRFGVEGFPTLVVARPGAEGGLRLTGWLGREKTLEFIDGAAGRLAEFEKKSAPKR
jgi:protein disulfide-isomerase